MNAESTPNYLDPQVLSGLQGLMLRTRHVIDGFLSGTHASPQAGVSSEYTQHRPYVPGDDLRRLDWKAYGRTDRLYVRQYSEETNLACTFLLDASASMTYQGSRSPLSKYQYASCLVASLAWLLRDQGDAVGLALCHSGAAHRLPPAAIERQLSDILKQIETTRPAGNESPARALRDWAIRAEHRQLVVLVSDLLTDVDALLKSLSDLRQFGHEVIVFQVNDLDELDFPFDRFTEFTGVESGQMNALDADLYRTGYLEKFADFQRQLQVGCERAAIDFLSLSSLDSLGLALGRFLTLRNLK